ncbi:MAG TPA: FAD-dependent oxidoreductase [Caulobacteraceae bacterium]|nr:FAD-dependent oxidoreductase [Caulobacteraceae bacterium]
MAVSVEPLERADQSVVIVGAGLAGVRVAEGLRAAGFPGRIVLVGDEPHAPYDRPPLSKAVLQEEGQEHAIGLSPEGAMAALNVELKLGRAGVAIRRQARELELSDGERIGFDRLVLATGSSVRTLETLPLGAPGVHYMRGLDDALALRAALTGGARVAIVGGGVIGLEVAASARARGCAVTVIEAGDRAMARAASPTISAFMEDRHRREGVDLRLGLTVVGADIQRGAPVRMRLSTGEVLEADVVVVGVGVTPNLDLIGGIGLEAGAGGVMVDGHGATSDPAIYAAGEVAVHFNQAYGRHDRQENWAHAAAHGEHVGRALAAPSEAYHQVTSYWTDQYDINLQVVGAPFGERDVVRGDLASGRFLVFHLASGRIEGVSAVNAVRELRAAKRLIGAPQPADLSALADPAANLAALA